MPDAGLLVYEVSAAPSGAAAALFAGIAFDRAPVEAVFEGRQQGRLFVDHAAHPRAALLCRTYDWYVAGDHRAAGLRRFIADAPAEAGLFETFYDLVPAQPSWVEELVADSGGRLTIIPRRGFTHGGGPEVAEGAARPPAPGDVVVRTIDRDLAERIDQEMGEHIGLFWGGYASFAAGGFGYCAVVGERPASAAYAVSVSRRYANISVGTAEPFRRRGLATLVCSRFVARCIGERRIVEWDADGPNAASIALARRLGFREDASFTELGLPGRVPPVVSHGRWQRHVSRAGGPAVMVWRREAGGCR